MKLLGDAQACVLFLKCSLAGLASFDRRLMSQSPSRTAAARTNRSHSELQYWKPQVALAVLILVCLSRVGCAEKSCVLSSLLRVVD